MTFIVDGSNGLTFPNSTVQASAGSVLQVVSVSNQTTYTTTSSSMSATFTASITPKFSTSKIFVLVNCSAQNANGGGMGIAIARNGSLIWNPSMYDSLGYYGALYSGLSNTPRGLLSMSYLDSPATTSSTSYGLYFASRSSATTTINPNDNNYGGSTITLMEIAG